MAITTLDGVVSGLQPVRPFAKALAQSMSGGVHTSFWPFGGLPAAGTYDATLNGATLSSSSAVPTGALHHVDPGSGNAYLARLSAACTQAGMLLLCDRLWQNRPAVNDTTAQSITSPTWPARDANGSTNGDGVLLAFEISASAGTAVATVTVTYTNQAGTGSRSAGFGVGAPTGVTAGVGQFYPIALQAGDTGVRSVQTVQFGTAWITGTINLVAYRVIAVLELPGAQIPNAVDAVTSGLPRVYNGAVPFLVFIPTGNTNSTIVGTYTETQG